MMPLAMANVGDINIIRKITGKDEVRQHLAELGIPMVIALNMIDLTRKNGDVIDMKKLGQALGCEVVETSALKGTGCKEATQKATALISDLKPESLRKLCRSQRERQLLPRNAYPNPCRMIWQGFLLSALAKDNLNRQSRTP